MLIVPRNTRPQNHGGKEMSDHNNPNLGRALDEIVQTVLARSDADTQIAVHEERARTVYWARRLEGDELLAAITEPRKPE